MRGCARTATRLGKARAEEDAEEELDEAQHQDGQVGARAEAGETGEDAGSGTGPVPAG